jgi:hypothetical protein
MRRNWRDIEKLASNIKSIFERRKDMKKSLVVLMAVAALTGLMAVPVFAADKLVVKDAGGSNTKFVVRDDGTVGVNNPTALGYNLDVSAGQIAGPLAYSQLHFSLDGTDTGGWISTGSANNFFVSSGTSVINGQWIQKSPDGNAVIAGSGGVGFRIFTSAGNTLGSPIALSTRMHIDFNGNVGFGVAPTTNPLTFANGAYLSAGGVWQNASSREYKDDIQSLSAEKAVETLNNLTPVTFHYKNTTDERHVGFIAEDVPDLVAMKDRKALSSMDIVAVLTRVVQEQNKMIQALSVKIDMLEKGTPK